MGEEPGMSRRAFLAATGAVVVLPTVLLAPAPAAADPVGYTDVYSDVY